MIVRVDCVPDGHGDPRPVRLHLGTRSIDLERILDVWPGADHTYVRAEDAAGTTWTLRHDCRRHVWQVTMYQRRPR